MVASSPDSIVNGNPVAIAVKEAPEDETESTTISDPVPNPPFVKTRLVVSPAPKIMPSKSTGFAVKAGLLTPKPYVFVELLGIQLKHDNSVSLDALVI